MRSDLPSGTVTFLFTDVEGSTRLLHSLGAEAYAQALAEHRRLIREACASEGGVEVDTQGDAFFFAFPTAPGAVAAAGAFTEALSSGPIQVRVGLHTGSPLLAEEGYVGHDVHRAARIAAAGHGGQVLVSSATAELCNDQLQGLSLTDLGEHRFKDLSAPERVYQVGAGEFPPLKTLYRTNLPVPATSFLGRERELLEVSDLLRCEDVRLLTLTGPGGTGKTRLALQAAAEASDAFPDGVFWVALAPVRDPSLVVSIAAQALEVPEAPGTQIVDAVARAYASKRALVVIDNCEHVVDAVAAVVEVLLARCTRVVLAATSRERLGLRGESVFAVPTMEATDSEALFVERARQAQGDFEPDARVPSICAAVDGLPLAIELAAARVRSLSPQAILERLGERLSLLTSRDRGVDDRQRTLEATIAWSYELLDAEEQRVLRALSVFAGGCTLEGAAEVAGADLDLLEALLDKSLIRHRVDQSGRDRYWMLETIREFAARELERAGEGGEVRERVVRWVLELMRRVGPRWAEPAVKERLDLVLSEEGNIRIALELAIASGAGDTAVELVGLMGRTWLDQARFTELGSLSDAALALGTGDASLEAFALLSRGFAGQWLERDAFARAVDLFGEASMRREAAYASMCLGVAEGNVGGVDVGLDLLRAALREFESLGDAYCASITENNIDYLEGMRWPLERDEALRLAARARAAVERARAAGDLGDEVSGLDNLSHTLIDAGDLEEAWAVALRAAAMIVGERIGWYELATIVAALARCSGLRGDHEQALKLASAMRSLEAELGQGVARSRLASVVAVETVSAEALGEESAARARTEGEAMSVELLLEYLAALE